MTANGRGTMRPQGRTPSFLLIGLLVVMCILGYSYWSVASTSSDQALQIVTLQDEVRMLSTRKMEADKQKEASVDRVGVLEKRNAGLVAEMQEKLKAVESVKSELGRKEDELRNANTEVDNKGAALTKCEQDFNGIKEELQKLKEETESLKGNMDKKPAQCDQNACEEPIKNILTVLVNSLGRQQIIATLQSNGIDSNKFIPAEAGQNAGSNSNLQPFNQGGQSPYNQGQNPAGQNPAGQLQVQNPPQNPVDQKQPQNPANQQQPQNPANQQQPQNPANQQPQNPADQQQPQNPADQQQPQNPANQQQPQNPANQQPQNPGDQQLPQNPADQPQQGLNVVPQPNLNQDGNPGQQNVVGLKGKGGNSEHAVGVSASVNSSTMHEQGDREVPSSDGKADSIALAKESNVTVQESKDTNKAGEISNGGLLEGLLTNAKRLLTNAKKFNRDFNETVRLNKTETSKAGVTTTTSSTPKGRTEDGRDSEKRKETETNKTSTNDASKFDGKGPNADDKGNGAKDQKEGQDVLQNGKDKEAGDVLKRVDMANNGDKDPANQEEHKEEDPKLKFEPKDLKHPSDLEQDEDAIDRMKDNMALEDRKPDGSYKIEESEGI
ncbi:protein GOLM2-like isoform X2 [Haliotis asinina]|uniref:protein GOLM2-like isoform X2 n=1 Tax=Haliotis asinina TaxID=109174 RepID=UPI003532415D